MLTALCAFTLKIIARRFISLASQTLRSVPIVLLLFCAVAKGDRRKVYMAEIIGVGACVLDTLYCVPRYPDEDTKLRASDKSIRAGGPASTALTAASRLGAACAYIGTLSDDGDGEFLKRDFEKYGVSTAYIRTEKNRRAFSSVILISESGASRTCIYDIGDLPPTKIGEREACAIKDARLLLIDGNDTEAALQAAKIAHGCGTLVLYDAGKELPESEALLSLTDILIPSAEFALAHTGCSDIESAARLLFEKYSPRVTVITDGKRGGVLYDGAELTRYPAFPVTAVDTNGAGDVFHGAFAAALVRGFSFREACIISSATSAIKCTGLGARESTPDFDTVMNFLKEKGYEL